MLLIILHSGTGSSPPLIKRAHSIGFRERWMPGNFRFFTSAFARYQPQNFMLGSTSTA